MVCLTITASISWNICDMENVLSLRNTWSVRSNTARSSRSWLVFGFISIFWEEEGDRSGYRTGLCLLDLSLSLTHSILPCRSQIDYSARSISSPAVSIRSDAIQYYIFYYRIDDSSMANVWNPNGNRTLCATGSHDCFDYSPFCADIAREPAPGSDIHCVGHPPAWPEYVAAAAAHWLATTIITTTMNLSRLLRCCCCYAPCWWCFAH